MINLGAGNIISSSTALLTIIAVLTTNENISKLKIRFTKLSDWINEITLLYEKTLKQSMVDKKIDEKDKDALELKKIYNYYLYMRKDITKKFQLKLEGVFA